MTNYIKCYQIPQNGSLYKNVYKEVAIMLKNKERSVDWSGVFGLSLTKHITLQIIIAHDFQYDHRKCRTRKSLDLCCKTS
jgi:hypothetical protein